MGFLSGIGGSLGGVGLGSAVVAVAVDTAPLKAGLEAAKGEVAASTASMSASTKAIGTGFIIAGAASVLAMGKAVGAVTDLAMATRGLQRVTGQTAESASSLLFVAHELGVDAASLSQGFGLLAKNIDMNAPVLAKFGIATKDASGATLDFNTILGEAADKYLALGGGMQGAAFSMELFGRGGKALIPILAQGSAGINELEAAAKQYGVVLSQDTLDKVITLAHAQRELSSAFQGLKIAIGTDLLPVVTGFTNVMKGLVLAIGAIPGPILTGVLALTALTGALFLIQKIVALVSTAWTPLLGMLGLIGPAAYSDAAAMSALAAGLTVEEAAAIGAAGGTTAFATALEALSGPVGWAILAITALVTILTTDSIRTAAAKQATSELTSVIVGLVPPVQTAAEKTQALADALVAQKAAQDALLPGLLGLMGDTQSLAAAKATEAADTRQLTQDQAKLNAAQNDSSTSNRKLHTLMQAVSADHVKLQGDILGTLNAQQSFNTDLKDEAQKLVDSGKSADFVIGKLDGLAQKAGMSGGAIRKLNDYVQGLIDKLNNIPAVVTSQINIVEHFSTTGSTGHVQGGRT